MTPELLRFHAAGHLAAAHALASAGYPDAARHVLGIVKAFTESPRVQSPPAIGEIIDKAIETPVECAADIALLEGWFCDPFNTVIEKSGSFR